MRKWLCGVLAIAAVVSFGSCACAEWKFDRKIQLVCPWGAGGGADSTLRPLAANLKKVLDVDVEVINVTGRSGVEGVEYTYNQPADGYTFMLGTQSIIMEDLQGETSMDFKTEFVPVVKIVHSVNIIAASRRGLIAKSCRTFPELVAYAKENPNVVKAGMLTAMGVDDVSLRQSLEGLEIEEIPYDDGMTMNADLVKGRIDIIITGLQEIGGLIMSGDLLPICAVSEKRIKLYPDMVCTGELGINSYMGPWRGIFAKKGTPQEAIDALAAAVEKAVNTPAWQDFLRMSAYDERPGYAAPADFAKLFDDEYASLTTYLKEKGLLKKEYK